MYKWFRSKQPKDNSDTVEAVLRVIQPQINRITYAQIDTDKKIDEICRAIGDINAKLRPPIRQRLEQCNSAIQIQTKFLNEIWDEVNRSGEA